MFRVGSIHDSWGEFDGVNISVNKICLVFINGPLISLSASQCEWTVWYDDEADHNRTFTPQFETEFLFDLRLFHHDLCESPVDIQCVTKFTNVSYQATGENVTCDHKVGLTCFQSEEFPCSNYIVRFFCCSSVLEVTTTRLNPPDLETCK